MILTSFEHGIKSFKQNSEVDYARVISLAKQGKLDDISIDYPGAFLRYFNTLKHIARDNIEPVGMERSAVVYWGPTRCGKSHRAWAEAGYTSFPKNSRTKWWDGYRGQEHVIVEEFRGAIDIGYLLLWLDKYPVIVEIKGGSVLLTAKRLWFTSNRSPEQWYPDIDQETRDALFERITIVHMSERYVPPVSEITE